MSGRDAATRTGTAVAADPAVRRARWGVTAVFLLNGGAFATWAARVPTVAGDLRLSTGQLALALFGLAAGSVVGLVGTGALTARVGSRPAALLGLAVLAVAMPAIAAAGSLTSLIGVLAVFGLGHSVLDVAMNAQALRVAGAYRGAVLGAIHASWSVGGLLGALIGSWFAASSASLGAHLGTYASVLAAAGLAGCLAFLPGPDADGPRRSWPRPDRRLLLLGLVAVCAFVGEGTVNDWSAVFLAQVGGASAGVAGLGFAGFATCMAIGRVLSDRLVGRWGRAGVLRLAALVAAAGLGTALLLPAPPWGLVGFAVLGLGLSAVIPVVFAAAGDHVDGPPGPAVSLISTLGYTGFLSGPVVVGGIAGVAGLPVALVVVLVMIALLFPLAGRVAPTGR